MESRLSDVKDKLRYIQSNEKESYLFPYLQQLFTKIGYRNVQITHGKDEYGKDLIFSEYDEKIHIFKHTAVIVKNKDAGMHDYETNGEIQRQIDLSFKCPYLNDKGEEIYINSVIVVINGSISFNAKEILNRVFHPSHSANIQNWNYQRLAEEIYNKISHIFLSPFDPRINLFLKKQECVFLEFNSSNEIYRGLSVKDVNDIYVNVRTSLKKHRAAISRYTNYERETRKNPIEEPDDSLTIVHSNNSFVIHGIAYIWQEFFT